MPDIAEEIEWSSPDSVTNCVKEIKSGGVNVSFGWCEPKLGESGDMLEDLCTQLTKSRKIQALDLENAGLSDSAVEQMCNALKKNKSLHTLILTGNDLGAIAGKAIADLLKLNKNLKRIDLSGNPKIPAWHMEEIEEALKGRQ